MRIIINIISVTLGQGAIIREANLTRYLSQIDKDNEYLIVGQHEKASFFNNLPSNFRYVSVHFMNRTLWEIFNIPGIAKRFKADIIYSPHHKSIFLSPCKKVIVIQNAAPFDSDVIKYSTPYQKFRLHMLRFGTRLSVFTSKHVIFLSKNLEDSVRRIGISPVESSVIYGGVPPGFEPKGGLALEVINDLELPDKYILFISHLYRYKNIAELVKAYAMVRNRVPFDLVIMGRLADKRYYNEITKYISINNMQDRVKFTGFVSHNLLPYLYSNCVFFVFPSTCESISYILLEAMACGAPIACSNLSVMPEICGDAALYFNPNNVSEIASTMLELSENSELREQLRKKSLQRAKEFSWQESAKQTLKIFEGL